MPADPPRDPSTDCDLPENPVIAADATDCFAGPWRSDVGGDRVPSRYEGRVHAVGARFRFEGGRKRSGMEKRFPRNRILLTTGNRTHFWSADIA